jgi:hypothetical protein
MRDFDRIAKRLIAARNQRLVDRIAILQRFCPELVRQMETDRGPSGPLIFWGRCKNVDELACRVIVEPTILETLFRIAEQRFSPEHPHAGLQHTYGYLLSVIDTPYGRKRDRWVRTSLESAFGLPPDVLGPSPTDGTLLANATWLAGSIAFQGHDRLKWMQRCLLKRVARSLPDMRFDLLKKLRYTETVLLPMSRGSRSRVSLVTDLVCTPCLDRGKSTENWLLVYSIDDDRNQHPQLVTLFTVTEQFVQAIRERAATRRRSDLRLRYNAHVSGFPTEAAGTVQLVRH